MYELKLQLPPEISAEDAKLMLVHYKVTYWTEL